MSSLNNMIDWLKNYQPAHQPKKYRPEYIGTRLHKTFYPIYSIHGVDDPIYGIPEADAYNDISPSMFNKMLQSMLMTQGTIPTYSRTKDKSVFMYGMGSVFEIQGRIAKPLLLFTKNVRSGELRLYVDPQYRQLSNGTVSNWIGTCVRKCGEEGIDVVLSKKFGDVFFERVSGKLVFKSAAERFSYNSEHLLADTINFMIENNQLRPGKYYTKEISSAPLAYDPAEVWNSEPVEDVPEPFLSDTERRLREAQEDLDRILREGLILEGDSSGYTRARVDDTWSGRHDRTRL